MFHDKGILNKANLNGKRDFNKLMNRQIMDK